MGLLCDYFIAASAEDAEETLDWAGGPGSPPPPTGILRRRAAAPHTTVALGIEPTTGMGKLEEILTQRSFEQILADPTGKVTAMRNGGERVIVPLTTNLQNALVALDDGEIDEVAARWAEPDEFYGTEATVAASADALRQLVGLARTARQRGESLFCWVCV